MDDDQPPSAEPKRTRFSTRSMIKLISTRAPTAQAASYAGSDGSSFILKSPEEERRQGSNSSMGGREGFLRRVSGKRNRGRSSATGNEMENPPIISPTENRRRSRCNLTFSPATLDFMESVVDSRTWGTIVLTCTIILLFGSSMQELWITPDLDFLLDIIFAVVFVILFTDIVLRSIIDPSYFILNFRRKDYRTGGPGENFRLGSFMFWCDLISTLTLLYDISFINRTRQRITSVEIVLDAMNIPVEGFEAVNRAIPIEFETEIIIAICRTTRVARLIQAPAVVKTSSKLNWYWVPQHLNPMFYLRWLRRRGAKNKQGETESEKAKVTSISWLDVVSYANYVQRRNGADNTSEELRRGFRSFFKSCLSVFGMGSEAELQAQRRHIAAAKIQRAWRKTIGHHAPGEHGNWEGRREGDDRPTLHKQHGAVERIVPRQRQSMRRSSVSLSQSRSESQVGSAMRELTGQRVTLGIISALILTVLFTYTENDGTRPSTMIILHNQTQIVEFEGYMESSLVEIALQAARSSAIPDLYEYQLVDGNVKPFSVELDPEKLRDREKMEIRVIDSVDNSTKGMFVNRDQVRDIAVIKLAATLFVLLIWFFGVTAFAGPVMTLVVIPIERMIRLLSMLMRDPLGYQSTARYKRFVGEEDELTRNTRWTKEVLKGMETSFLMSTILRIGSLMKVGFGSAGVEIIRNNLEKGQKKELLFLNSQGSTVSCVFLFCDIRQFTDATECLQEEVFVFTNKIAAVVHSICHSYGGSANKNIGDAFLLSWLLDDGSSARSHAGESNFSVDLYGHNDGNAFLSNSTDRWSAKQHQADKALLSVVRILIALQFDNFYLETLSEKAQNALKKKMSKRKGPLVQMGFGLHAGKAVQGAIGSQRKLDATYVSESVERAEFLESSTKKYQVKMLMSDAFHRLLHPSNQRRCRKVDQVIIHNEDDDISDDGVIDEGDVMELYTFDLDIEALWRAPPAASTRAITTTESDTGSDMNNENVLNFQKTGSKREILKSGKTRTPRRRVSMILGIDKGLNNAEEAADDATQSGVEGGNMASSAATIADAEENFKVPELLLPTGPALYNANVWVKEDMRRMRQLYYDGVFFQKFDDGLKLFYERDWERARQCFQKILETFEDGPSRYFLNQIEENNGVPPRNFSAFGSA